MKINYWNAASNEWVEVESHLNTVEYFVWANVDHFSLWTLTGELTAAAPPLPPSWLLVPIVLGMIVIGVAAVFVRRQLLPPFEAFCFGLEVVVT